MPGGVEKLSHDELVQVVLDLRAEVVRLRKRIAELEGKKPTVRLQESYSIAAEQKRREKEDGKEGKTKRKQNSQRRGRLPGQDKIDQADEVQLVLPDGYDIAECTFVRERPVWRIIDGRAKRVVYEIYCGPDGQKTGVSG